MNAETLADPVPPVELLSVEKRFVNGVQGLEPTTLRVEPGEFITIIGPSGCGKSTLLKLASGLVEPSDGRVWWWRGPFARVGENTRRLAFVFQDPTLMPWADVATNVRLPLDLAHVRRSEADARVAAALAEIGLSAHAGKTPRELSGGMRMRVSIARALVLKPALLLMDEPFAALDEITRFRLNDDLVRLKQELGTTIVFVTHSVYESVYLSTRIAIMTPRPGHIATEISISDQTRDEKFRMSAAYGARCAEVSARLQAAMGENI